MDFRNCHPPHSNELLTHKAAREATDELATLLKVVYYIEQQVYCAKFTYLLLYMDRTNSQLLALWDTALQFLETLIWTWSSTQEVSTCKHKTR